MPNARTFDQPATYRIRVQGNLGKMEARDKLAEYKTAMEPAYEKAKTTLADATRAGAEETKTMAKSLLAAWDELRRTHRTLSEEAELERARAQELKRKPDA